VAGQALQFSRLAGPGASSRPALVNGAVGLVSFRDGKLFSVLGFTVVAGRIVALDILADADRLAQLDLVDLD
jgi:RNA polymerase sigma-70 factor (ECF subfamily)